MSDGEMLGGRCLSADCLWSDALAAWHECRIYGLISLAVVATVLRLWTSRRQDVPAEVSKTTAKSEVAVSRIEHKTAAASSPRNPKQDGPRRIRGKLRQPDARPNSCPVQVYLFYSSITTNTERIANEYVQELDKGLANLSTDRTILPTQLLDLSQVDLDDYFIAPPRSAAGPTDAFYLVLLPSYNIDTINDTFLEHLGETHHDFRIDTAPLAPLLGYSVFGFGDREGWPAENDGFCFQAKEVDRWLAKLTGRKRAFPVGMGDVKGDYAERLREWSEGVLDVLDLVVRTGSLGDGLPGSGAPDESDGESAGESDDEVLDEEQTSKRPTASKVTDLEDLGSMMQRPEAAGPSPRAPLAIDFTTGSSAASKAAKPPPRAKEMVPRDSPTYASLTKQGYSIVGSHSGVKICRWTKSALRGRGSCYKFSFYGINSHQCMETTPSLSCSNKCIFCWRHGTNPVGTTWRWVVDPPDLIFEGVKRSHYQKIKVLRGMAGVRAERYAEAQRIRHCALSLVGEPIFYPHINEFLALLHAERISSFLVCNAQHPEQLAALGPVTQLYVSIDASNKESLRRIDRPLHRDFWERFQRCLDILRERRHRRRTVFRLTLVKGFNVEDEAEGYADLVERALPCFVEVKGVTYCGTSTSANAGLTMGNVPFYAEVCDFVRALERRLRDRGLAYGIAAEHAHSCCVLIGSERFRVGGKWRTLIDYEKFFRLLEERGVDGEWTPEEYMGDETAEWATWGNGGFDPRDDRVDRKGRKIEV